MNIRKYIPRIIEKELKSRVKEFPVIALTGPRQTGKSTLLKTVFKDYNYVCLDNPFDRELAIKDPCLFLENNSLPLIIDEIQYAPEIFSYIKIIVDERRDESGLFILTGSQIFPFIQGLSESMAGRVAIYELLGFSLEELESVAIDKTFLGCYKLIFSGFYPDACLHRVGLTPFYSSYLRTYLERDLRQLKNVHDLLTFQSFLELIASRVGGILNLSEIAKECGISHTTARNWLSILEVSRIVYLLPPYFKNISKRIVKSPKIYFTDTGLLSYILRYPSYEILSKGPSSGMVFENFVLLELLKYKVNHNCRFELYFYRDFNHNEADVIIDMGHKKILVEIRSSTTIRSQYVKKLEKIADLLGTEEILVISNYPKKAKISQKASNIPWWQIDNIFEGGK